MGDLLIIGLVKCGEGYKVVAPDKTEYECEDKEDLHEIVDKLFEGERPEVKTSTPKNGRRTAEEIKDFDEKIERVGDGIGEYLSHEYGETVGRVTKDAVTKGTRGLTGFLRKISRP